MYDNNSFSFHGCTDLFLQPVKVPYRILKNTAGFIHSMRYIYYILLQYYITIVNTGIYAGSPLKRGSLMQTKKTRTETPKTGEFDANRQKLEQRKKNLCPFKNNIRLHVGNMRTFAALIIIIIIIIQKYYYIIN